MKHGLRTSIAAIGAAALLAACSGQGGDEPTPVDGPVDLRMTVWTASEDHLALFQEIADAYVEEHPDEVSSVTFESVPFEDYTSTLTTQIAGGNPPDLAWIFESSAIDFVDSGALTDLRPGMVDDEAYAFDDIDTDLLQLWGTDSELYAYPFSSSPFVMFVNTDRVAEAGLTTPSELLAAGDWTFDEAAALSAGSVDALGGHGLVVRDFDYQDWTNLATVWSGWGAEPWTADGECAFTDPAMADAMTWIHDAAFQSGAMPEPGVAADFFAGDVTMTITQISRASALDGSFEWEIVPLPAGPAGVQNVIGQAGIGVLSAGQAPSEAADFLRYFTNPENAAQLAAYFPPPRESLLNAETLAASNPLLSEEQLAIVVDSMQGAVTKPSYAGFAELSTAVRTSLDPMWQADADVPGVLAEVCTAIGPLLDR